MCSMEREREGMAKARKNQTFFNASCKQMQPKWMNGKSIHTPHEVDADEAEKHLINKSMVLYPHFGFEAFYLFIF